jgi:16S rRNA (guanine527-N7)-methyltransferase
MIALLHSGPVTLVEQRRLRAAFLERAAAVLGLEGKIQILCANVRQLSAGPFDVISARAFAPLDRLFASAAHLAANGTRWILPKGKNAKSELEAARASWQGRFRLEPSVTDPAAAIVIAEQVRFAGKGKRRS